MPRHIAIIPDGNRRWAKEKGLPTFEGHRIAAEKTFPDLIEKLAHLGVNYFTFWALSTENIAKRSSRELNKLFNLMRYFLKNKLAEFKKKGVRLKIIGNIQPLPKDIRKNISKAVVETEDNEKITLILALNYGGKDEIIRAIKKVQSLNKENFSNFLDTNGIPDPDLIIRTGGEKRLSGFMLWQSEYSELYFTDTYFPDFTPEELEKAINDYSLRQRRFGK